MMSIRYGLKGPNHSVVTACATGAHAIGDAARLIMPWTMPTSWWRAAPKAPIGPHRHGRLRSPARHSPPIAINDTPEKASRPWDKDRDGFVMGEGAGVVVLEELRARQGPRRQDLRRGDRLRPDRRRLSHHRACRRRRRRLPRHAMAAEAGRHKPGRHRLPERPRHLDAARPTEIEVGRGRSGCSAMHAYKRLHVVHQVGHDRPSPGRRRRGRSDLLHACHARPASRRRP